jgi:mono/diheme cytochrome c family protein
MTALALTALITFLAPGRPTPSPPAPLNQCVVCHLSASNTSARIHLTEWLRSAHARQGITCDRCHGGDPSTARIPDAHRGIVSSRYAISRVSRRHLPETCGECHISELDAFRKSAHYTLLEQNVRLGPVCSDCHGATATTLPEPSTLEARCARCHLTQSVGADRPRLARQTLQDIEFVRAILQRTARHIEWERDLARYERLQREQREARVLLTATIDALHSFNQREASERLLRARESAEALLEQLAPQPSPPPARGDRPIEPGGRGSLLIASVYGPDLFRAYCSECHGRDAKGHGSANAAGDAPDLTAMARRHGGSFPREQVTAIVSGQSTSLGHSPSAMPPWGTIFQALDPRDRWPAIRVENVIAYLESIQR